MPRGIYKRTEEHLEIVRNNMKKAREVAWKLPRTAKQIRNIRELGKTLRTPNQIATFRKNAQKVNKLPRTQKQLKALSRGRKLPKHRVFANTIAKHHNDLCHGAERPDDVTYMTMSEHSRLHAKVRRERAIKEVINDDHKIPSKIRL